MATTTTIPDVLDYLQTTLSRRAGLAGVLVLSGALSATDAPPEAVFFDSTFDQTDWDAIGNLRRNETYDLRGGIWIEKSGAGEATIRQARDRAFAILGEIETMLVNDHRMGGLTLSAIVGEIDLDQGVAATGRRVARISFTVRVRAHLTRT